MGRVLGWLRAQVLGFTKLWGFELKVQVLALGLRLRDTPEEVMRPSRGTRSESKDPRDFHKLCAVKARSLRRYEAKNPGRGQARIARIRGMCWPLEVEEPQSDEVMRFKLLKMQLLHFSVYA